MNWKRTYAKMMDYVGKLSWKLNKIFSIGKPFEVVDFPLPRLPEGNLEMMVSSSLLWFTVLRSYHAARNFVNKTNLQDAINCWDHG